MTGLVEKNSFLLSKNFSTTAEAWAAFSDYIERPWKQTVQRMGKFPDKITPFLQSLVGSFLESISLAHNLSLEFKNVGDLFQWTLQSFQTGYREKKLCETLEQLIKFATLHAARAASVAETAFLKTISELLLRKHLKQLGSPIPIGFNTFLAYIWSHFLEKPAPITGKKLEIRNKLAFRTVETLLAMAPANWLQHVGPDGNRS